MNCYKCKFRGGVIGSAHSSCSVIRQAYPEKGSLLELALAGGHIKMGDSEGNPLVEIDQWGIVNGWGTWPIDFDPVWIKNCKFFSVKDNTGVDQE
jgi:hypothetical protein